MTQPDELLADLMSSLVGMVGDDSVALRIARMAQAPIVIGLAEHVDLTVHRQVLGFSVQLRVPEQGSTARRAPRTLPVLEGKALVKMYGRRPAQERRALLVAFAALCETWLGHESALRHDPLTDLFNALAYREARSQHQQNSTRCGVLVADVDGLKALNEARGHLYGDDVIRATGRALDQVVPAVFGPDAQNFRLFGDAFVTLFPATAIPDTNASLASMHRCWPTGAPQTSFGLSLQRPDETLDDALRRAEQDMFHRKRHRV